MLADPVRPPTHTRRGRALAARWWAPALLTLLMLLAYGQFLGLALTGGDSWPHLWTSRVASPADLWALFTHSVLFKTSFVTSVGLFYRPLSLLSYAIDEALFGLNPVGYHVTDLLIHLVDVLLLYALLRGLGVRRWAAALGAAALGLNPVAVTLLPSIPRRHDSLAAIGVLGALLSVQPLVRVCLPRGVVLRYAALAAVLLGAAELSKESAFAGLPLLLLWLGLLGLAHRRQPGGWRRLAIAAAAAVAVSGVLFAIRWQVLHGLGGYYEGTSLALDNLQPRIADYFQRLLWPFADQVGRDPRGLYGTVAVLLVVPGMAVARVSTGARLAVVFGWLWIAVLWAFQLYTNSLAPYQMYLAVVGCGWLVAGTAEGIAVQVSRWRRSRPRGPGLLQAPALAVSVVVLLVFCGGTLRLSPFLTPYPQWTGASNLEYAYLAAIQPCLVSMPAGSTVRFDNIPRWIDDGSPQDQWVLASDFGAYSVGPAVDLLAPGQHFSVPDSDTAVDFASAPSSVQVTCNQAADQVWHVVATYPGQPVSVQPAS